MILDELVLHNFGLYAGRQVVPLAPLSEAKPIVLFGGQNGTGKTTFLDGIQLALYGKLAKCSNRGSLSYEEFLRRCISDKVDPAEGAAVELEFRYATKGTESRYRIRRVWSFNGKGIKENLEITKDGRLDRYLTNEWGDRVHEYFPSQIAQLFLFDGEKIEQLANLENSAELLSTAILSLFGLDIVYQLSTDLLVLEKKQFILTKDKREQEQLRYFEDELEKLQQQRSDLSQARGALINELEQTKKLLEKLEDNFRKQGGDLFEQREQLEGHRETARSNLHYIEEELRELAAGPYPIFLIRNLLDSLKRQADREESAFRARILNDELVKRDALLISTARQNRATEEVLTVLENFLSDERNERIQKARVNCYLNLTPESDQTMKMFFASMNDVESSCARLLAKYEEAKLVFDDVERRLMSIPDEAFLADLLDERERFRSRIQETQSRINVIDEDSRKLDREIEQKRSRMVSWIEKNVEIDFDREDRTRIIKYSQKVRGVLETFGSSVVHQNVNKLTYLILDSFNRLMKKKSLVRELSINEQDYTLILRDSAGKVLSPERLSAGERQLLALAILWGLARASGKPLPTAIDTPLGRLDSSHRRHLVERYFPYASHQVILFSTDEEINQKYYEQLKPHIALTYLLQYDDVDRSTRVQPGYYW